MFRQMRRIKQQLSEEECVRLLKQEPRGVLAVLGDGGYPYTVPMDFLYEDGKLYFHCAAAGHKMDAIAACDKVSFCVMDQGYRREGEWALNIKSVIVFGRIRKIEDRAEIIERVRRMGLKYYPNAEDVEAEIRKDGARVCCLELTVDHMTGKLVNES